MSLPPRSSNRTRVLGTALSLFFVASCSGDSNKKQTADGGTDGGSLDGGGTGDIDDDGIADKDDNCPDVSNPDQEDADKDGIGDACDNCKRVSNVDQADEDDDGIGDACKDSEVDGDGDGVPDVDDNCPKLKNPDQADRDKDSVGDACDICPTIANIDQADANKDGVGDACADFTNSDGDPIPDYLDNCPTVTNPDQADKDGDGVGDVCDNCVDVANVGQQDFDADGIGDNCDTSLADAAVCADGVVPASVNKPNLYFLLDRSTSMGIASGVPTRIDIVKLALDNLAGSAQAPGPVISNFNIGVGAFPSATGSCDVADLPERLLPLVERTPAAAYTAFTGAYTPIQVAGHTPTDRALAQVRTDQLYNMAGDPQANRPKAVVLITDGLPNDCIELDMPNRVDETVAEAGMLAALGVPVFALGFPGVGAEAMQRIANAGDPAPGDNVWYPVTDTASINAALEQIIERTAGCTIALEPTGRGATDQGILTVELVQNNGATRTAIARDAVDGYSQVADVVTLHGASCSTLQKAVVSDATARVEARMGCACVPSTEMCGDVKDNDCNGKVDEICVPSNQCGVDAPEADCPSPDACTREVCDGKDNDCDGQVDDGCPTVDEPDAGDILR